MQQQPDEDYVDSLHVRSISQFEWKLRFETKDKNRGPQKQKFIANKFEKICSRIIEIMTRAIFIEMH